MLSRLERRRIRLEVKCGERHRKRRRLMICTGNVNCCEPRAQIHRRKNDERNWRGREDQRWMARHRDLGGVRGPAETASEEVKATCLRKKARHGGHVQREAPAPGRRGKVGGFGRLLV